MKPTIYIETSVVSYLVGWLNRNSLLVATNQQLTRDWWERKRTSYELFASTVVIDEARKGEDKLAAERLDLLRDIALLDVTPEAQSLATELVQTAKIPKKAEIDALHIAIAAINGMTYLLSWNCAHIVNAATLPSVYQVCRRNGYEPPFVCTPLELMGDDYE